MAASDETSPLSLDELSVLLPQYEICDFIAMGGMGAVYLARQASLDRHVAIKVLPPLMEDEAGFTERFKSEARAMAKLMHNNIVAVYDFGLTVTGHHYLVMEYIDGQTLHDSIRLKKLKADKIKSVVLQLCDALSFAHEHGIVHRDIKPANILMTHDGRVKIADFGLARPLVAVEQDIVLGTPDYVAPEIMIEGAKVDHRADIFALGVVIFEMLLGRVPGVSKKPPSAYLPSAAMWDAVYLKATKHKPELRYRDIKEMRAAAAGTITPAWTPHSPRKTTRNLGNRASVEEEEVSFAVVPFMLRISLLALLLLGGWLWWRGRENHLEPRGAPGSTSSEVPLVNSREQSQDTNLVPGTLVSASRPQTETLLLKDVPVGHVSQLQAQHRDPIQGLVLFPDQRRAATASMDGTVKIWDLVRGEEIKSFGPFDGSMLRLAISNDGNHLAAGSSNYTVRVWEISSGDRVAETSLPGRNLNSLAFTQQDDRLLLACSDATKALYEWIWKNETARAKSLVRWNHLVNAIAIIPGKEKAQFMTAGGNLTQGGSTMQLWLGDWRTQESLLKLKSRKSVPNKLAVTRDGKLAAFNQGSDIHLVDVASDIDLAVCKGHRGFIETIIFVDDGRFLISGSQDKTVRVWETSTGQEVYKFQAATYCTSHLAISNDESWILSAGGARFASPLEKDGDYAIHIWRLPAFDSLITDQGRLTVAQREMQNLAQLDPELAGMRERFTSEWEAKKHEVSVDEKMVDLEAKYLTALQREVNSLPQIQKQAFLSEISRIHNKGQAPEKVDETWPDALKRLFGIYLEQATLLHDQAKKDMESLAFEQSKALQELVKARENDLSAQSRARVLLEEIEKRVRASLTVSEL